MSACRPKPQPYTIAHTLSGGEWREITEWTDASAYVAPRTKPLEWRTMRLIVRTREDRP